MTTKTKTTKTETVNFEVPADMREFAEKSVDQAKVVYGQFRDAAQGAVDMLDEQTAAFKGATTEFNVTALDFAQTNANAGFELARKLVAAKDLKEMFELQIEFARTQGKAFAEQGKELGAISAKVGEQAVQPLKEGMTKSFEQVKSSFPA
jgi:phasin